MLDFLTLNPEAFGIDISDSSLKIVKLNQKRGNLVLAAFGEILLKPGIIKKGRIINEIAFIKNLEKAVDNLSGKKLKTKYAVASLSEESVFLQVIKIPKMAKEEIQGAVRFEAENYIPLPLEKAYLDFQIISADEKKHYFEILIVAVPKEVVDPYISCFERVGIKLKALEVESMAIVRALIRKGENFSPILLIDLGVDKTTFIIAKNNSIRFSSSIPISAKKFTEAIARALEIEIEKAEKLKIKYGLKGPERIHLAGEKGTEKFKKEVICEEKVFEALIPILTDLIEQINIYLDYYQSHELSDGISKNERKKLEKIIICGGGANLKGICTFLSLELKILTEPGDPWINISKKIQMPLEDSLRYTTAIGLALRGINKN